jgi:hypothetical protein
MGKKCRTTVNEFAELGYGLNEMRVDEFSDPEGRFLSILCLEFDLKYAIPKTVRVL